MALRKAKCVWRKAFLRAPRCAPPEERPRALHTRALHTCDQHTMPSPPPAPPARRPYAPRAPPHEGCRQTASSKKRVHPTLIPRSARSPHDPIRHTHLLIHTPTRHPDAHSAHSAATQPRKVGLLSSSSALSFSFFGGRLQAAPAALVRRKRPLGRVIAPKLQLVRTSRRASPRWRPMRRWRRSRVAQF